MEEFQSRLTFANVVACLALFIALGGSAYAATQLPKNSVGAEQLKANAVTAAKVKAGSLLASDFKSGQVPSGERGPQGLPGSAGPPGSPGTPAMPGTGGSLETETVVESTGKSTVSPKELSVECPHGPVISGGFVAYSSANQAVLRVVRSYAVATNTWLVRALDDTDAQNWELTVSVICQK